MKRLFVALLIFASASLVQAADVTIGGLVADTAPTSTDVVEIEQSDASASNKATLANVITKAHGLGNWKWFYTDGSGVINAVGNGAAGTIPYFQGTSAAPIVSTFTLAAPGAAGGMLLSDGNNWTRATTLTGLTFGGFSTTAGTGIITDGSGYLVNATNVLFGSGYIALGADPADTGSIRLPNAGYIYSEADAAGTDISVIGVDSSEVVQIAASGASGVTITPSVNIGPAAPDDVQPTFAIRGDADSDAGGDTTEAFTITLTPNATPTLATWGFTSTQSAGYTFDKPVQAPAKFASFSGAATLTAAAHNGAMVMMTTADEVTMWDCTSSTIGHFVTLWARDAEKIEVVPASGDQFYLFNGTGIGADDELDIAATAGTKVTLMCTAADEWRVVFETAACTDGGAAD